MLTLEQFKSEFPDIHRSVFTEGYQAGIAAGKALSQSTPVRKEQENLTPEERAEKMWNEDVDLRLEYQGDKQAWMAFAKYDSMGKVHILGKRPG